MLGEIDGFALSLFAFVFFVICFVLIYRTHLLESKKIDKPLAILAGLTFILLVPMMFVIASINISPWYILYAYIITYYGSLLFLYIFYKNQQNRKKLIIYNELIKCIDIFYEELSIGHHVSHCVDISSRRLKSPMNKFMLEIHKRLSMGMDTDVAMKQSLENMPSLKYLQHFVLIISMHNVLGRSIGEELSTLKQKILQYEKQMKKIAVTVSLSKYSSLLTASLPLLAMLMFYVVDKSYLLPFLSHPLGPLVTAGCTLAIFTGVVLIFQLTKISFESMDGEPS